MTPNETYFTSVFLSTIDPMIELAMDYVLDGNEPDVDPYNTVNDIIKDVINQTTIKNFVEKVKKISFAYPTNATIKNFTEKMKNITYGNPINITIVRNSSTITEDTIEGYLPINISIPSTPVESSTTPTSSTDSKNTTTKSETNSTKNKTAPTTTTTTSTSTTTTTTTTKKNSHQQSSINVQLPNKNLPSLTNKDMSTPTTLKTNDQKVPTKISSSSGKNTPRVTSRFEGILIKNPVIPRTSGLGYQLMKLYQ
uniref:Ankyrin repeat-containing protein n=1 Tax=Strongyloides venezuelensis TaxID=75913 RepID=A0A0K0FB27_STRVS